LIEEQEFGIAIAVPNNFGGQPPEFSCRCRASSGFAGKSCPKLQAGNLNFRREA